MKNIELINYSLMHRAAFKLVAEKYCKEYFYKEIMLRAKRHDVDKVIMYSFLEKKEVSLIHRNTVSHHITIDNPISTKTEIDFLEMVIDWECARYTKKDKPLNAYQTLYKYYPELEPQILPILKRLGLYDENCTIDNEIDSILEYFEVTEEYIMNVITDYMKAS